MSSDPISGLFLIEFSMENSFSNLELISQHCVEVLSLIVKLVWQGEGKSKYRPFALVAQVHFLELLRIFIRFFLSFRPCDIGSWDCHNVMYQTCTDDENEKRTVHFSENLHFKWWELFTYHVVDSVIIQKPYFLTCKCLGHLQHKFKLKAVSNSKRR